MRADLWTPEMEETARVLRARRAPAAEYLTALGRSKGAAFSRLYTVDNSVRQEALRKVRLEKLRQGRIAGGANAYVAKLRSVPEDVILEAQKRREAPQTLTGSVFGDPPIGYRAIDRKREQESA